MLQVHASDPAFLQWVRQTDPEQPAPHSLAQCRATITQLRELLVGEDGQRLQAGFRRQILGDIKAVEDALQPLEHGTPALGRAVKALASMVNLWRIAVPSPLLGNQAKTFSYTFALASKGVMMLAASAARPTADGFPLPLFGGQLGRDANELHLYASVLNGIFLGTQIAKRVGSPSTRHQAESVEGNLGFSAAAATACAALVITPFIWSSVSATGNRVYRQAKTLGASITQRVGFGTLSQQWRASLTPGQISMHLRAQLEDITTALVAGRDAFQQARSHFSDPGQGRELTRTVNGQCTHLLETLDRCSKRLRDALQGDQEQPSSISRERLNDDFSSKISLALLGSGLSALGVYLVQPDKIGTADTLADTAIVTTVMLQSAFNRNATRQDTMERFKAMCGGSMVLALALGAEKLSKIAADRSLIEASSASPYYAGLVIGLMCLTMPGPVARGAELAMNWGGRQFARSFTGPDGTPLATGLPDTQEGMLERTRTTLAYFLELNSEQQQAFERLAADAALQAIQDAGAAAQPRASSVTITEVEDGTGAATGPRVPTEAGGTMEHGTVRDAGTHAPGGSNRGIGNEIEEESDATVSASASNAGSVRAYEPGDTTAGHPSDHH
ncbi:type III secretion system effector protein [Xanthomonas prunicola]|jgi:hypothetical protein|uniref:Type III secretion system effector protein n=2 Tax=Xanthomonas prunicola TaxID=2053930 RepID=A0A2N3RLE1_9XANT|nr:type III secretion system effector protein [Xanthomonas prunicola]PKV17601.1 type III secretion system effector protein [Xanthomonas prunicola]PKV21498.1 type III secretion system effector protein [Xanthomonas prunicola]